VSDNLGMARTNPGHRMAQRQTHPVRFTSSKCKGGANSGSRDNLPLIQIITTDGMVRTAMVASGS
jgi:hypothetical protein